MRFYDNEWEKLNTAATLASFCNWNVSDRASTYDEDLFNEVYQQMIEQYSSSQMELAKQEKTLDIYIDSLTEKFQSVLPDEIKQHICDFRVFVLGTVTEQVLEEIKVYSKEARMRLQQIDKDYNEQCENIKKTIPENAYAILTQSFHDSYIIDFGYDASDLYFILRMDGGFDRLEDQYMKLIFQDTLIIEGEINHSLRTWIYHELSYDDGMIELHINFSGGNVILRSVNVKREYYYSFFACDAPLQELENDEVAFGKLKDLIASGKIEREATVDDELRRYMGDEEYENMEILVMKDEYSLGRLVIHKSHNEDTFRNLCNKEYIYDIQFRNEWIYHPNDVPKSWVRGIELLQYIHTICEDTLELWSIWSDSFDNIEVTEYQTDTLNEADLEDIYDESPRGITKSRKIIITGGSK